MKLVRAWFVEQFSYIIKGIHIITVEIIFNGKGHVPQYYYQLKKGGTKVSQAHQIQRMTREHFQDGRHFLIDYEFCSNDDPKICSIKATLMEKSEDDVAYERVSCVEISHLNYQLIERIFCHIENAADPVFPVHIPDIIKDAAAETILDSITFNPSTNL